MRLVLDGVPQLALLLAHVLAVLRRARHPDVVGDHDRARMQPAPVEDALQVVQVGVLVVVQEHEIECARGESVLVGQRVQGAPAVADGADDARHAVGDPGMSPDLAGVGGVGFGEFDGVHLRVRSGAGDPQRAVTAVGAQFQRERGIGAPHRGVEELALLVADVDQDRLFVGELVDGGQHVVDVAGPGVLQDVVDRGRFASVTDLARLGDIARPGRHPPRSTTATAACASDESSLCPFAAPSRSAGGTCCNGVILQGYGDPGFGRDVCPVDVPGCSTTRPTRFGRGESGRARGFGIITYKIEYWIEYHLVAALRPARPMASARVA